MSKKAVLVNVSGDKDGERVLKELEALADTAGYTVEASLVQRKSMPDRRYYIGSGKLEELKNVVMATESEVVIFDNDLTGSQFHNLETYLGVTVIDRATLIIEIFAAHARSNEGKLQVELAAKRQALPRVIGKGIAMSRQGGGGGGGGGARRGGGEQQLELDKRTIRREIRELEQKIEKLGEERRLRREKRVKNDLKVVSIAGYTNAGKSTLMNALTKADVLEEDKLFATLDPLERVLRLKSGMKVILSDTVGFVSNLPHFLIDAFSSTLEEARLADALIIVLEASAEDLGGKWETTVTVLNELRAMDKPVILAVNKTDLGIREDFALASVLAEHPDAVMLSARTGEGLDELRNRIEETASALMGTQTVTLDVSDSAEIEECYRSGRLVSADYNEKTVTLVMRKK